MLHSYDYAGSHHELVTFLIGVIQLRATATTYMKLHKSKSAPGEEDKPDIVAMEVNLH